MDVSYAAIPFPRASRYARDMERLTTPSLQLDPLTTEDDSWFCAVYADPEVMRYIGTGVRTEQQTRTNLDILRAQANRLPFGYWVVRERQSNERLGGVLLMIRRDGAPVELGFLFARAAWGRGIATQAARAVVEHAFESLRIPLLEAFIDVQNAASAAVLRKAGFRDAGLTTGPYGGTDRKFVLAREDWAAANGRRP